MRVIDNPWLFWIPRVLALLLVGFVSLFALDVFGEGNNAWRTVVALAMHLIPAGIVLATLVVAWKWERVGGLLFLLAGLGYAYMARAHFNWILVMSGPLWVIGTLFLVGGRRRTHAGPRA
jgi:hypothetical protein